MKSYKCKMVQLTIVLIFAFLTINCSILRSTRDFEIPDRQLVKLNEQIKANRFEHIYQESSVLQAQISEEKFIKQLSQAIENLKRIDENLNFQDFEELRSTQEMLESRFHSVGVQKIEKNGRRIVMLSNWSRDRENEDWNLSSVSFIESSSNGESETSMIPRKNN